MCGIIGLITDERSVAKDASDRIAFVIQALIAGTLRGDDAAGMFACYRGKSEIPGFAKSTGTGYALLQSQHWYNLFGQDKLSNYKYIVGHNRAATQGGHTVEAAHPFQVGDITLVHNGTLSSTMSLPEPQYQASTVNDSHTICYNLANYDALEVLEAINGAFALVWHDARDDSLNIARNPERPLAIAKAAKSDTVYFASEGEMLYWLDSRIGLGLQQIVTVNPYYWMKFTPENGIKPKIRQFEKFNQAKNRELIKKYSKASNWKQSETSAQVPFQEGRTETPKAANTTELSLEDGTTVVPMHPKMERRPRGTETTTKTSEKVPESLQLHLMDYEISVDEPIEFCPILGEEILRGTDRFPQYTVTGKLRRKPGDPPTILGVIHGVSEATYANCCNRIWTVRAIGIKKTADDAPIIICRYIKSTAIDDGIEYTNQTCHTIRAGKVRDIRQPETRAKLYPGPNGSFLRYGDWKQCVAKGCISCGRVITAADADTLTWVNERQDPWCKECQQDFNLNNVQAKDKKEIN